MNEVRALGADCPKSEAEPKVNHKEFFLAARLALQELAKFLGERQEKNQPIFKFMDQVSVLSFEEAEDARVELLERYFMLCLRFSHLLDERNLLQIWSWSLHNDNPIIMHHCLMRLAKEPGLSERLLALHPQDKEAVQEFIKKSRIVPKGMLTDAVHLAFNKSSWRAGISIEQPETEDLHSLNLYMHYFKIQVVSVHTLSRKCLLALEEEFQGVKFSMLNLKLAEKEGKEVSLDDRLKKKDVAKFLKSLIGNVSLRYLKVDSKELSFTGVALDALAELVKTSGCLAQLKLSNMELNGQGNPMLEALKGNRSIKLLDLTSTSLDYQAMEFLSGNLKQSQIQWLAGLSVTENNLESFIRCSRRLKDSEHLKKITLIFFNVEREKICSAVQSIITPGECLDSFKLSGDRVALNIMLKEGKISILDTSAENKAAGGKSLF